jgi:hypothetical protein
MSFQSVIPWAERQQGVNQAIKRGREVLMAQEDTDCRLGPAASTRSPTIIFAINQY